MKDSHILKEIFLKLKLREDFLNIRGRSGFGAHPYKTSQLKPVYGKSYYDALSDEKEVDDRPDIEDVERNNKDIPLVKVSRAFK